MDGSRGWALADGISWVGYMGSHGALVEGLSRKALADGVLAEEAVAEGLSHRALAEGLSQTGSRTRVCQKSPDVMPGGPSGRRSGSCSAWCSGSHSPRLTLGEVPRLRFHVFGHSVTRKSGYHAIVATCS